MEVEVGVDVVEGEAGGVKFIELGVDFIAELGLELGFKEVIQTDPDGTVGEFAAVVDQIRDLGRRQGGVSEDQGQVEADAEAGMGFGEFDGFGEAGFVDHEAGGSEEAFAMGQDNGGIGGSGEPEVIGVEDEAAAGRGV